MLLGDRDGAGGDSDEGLPLVPPALEARVSSTNIPKRSNPMPSTTDATESKSNSTYPRISRQRNKNSRRFRKNGDQKAKSQSNAIAKKPNLKRQTSVKLGLDGQVIHKVDDDISSDDGGGAGHDRRLLAQLGLTGGGGGIIEQRDEQFLAMDESMLVFVNDETTLAEAMVRLESHCHLQS